METAPAPVPRRDGRRWRKVFATLAVVLLVTGVAFTFAGGLSGPAAEETSVPRTALLGEPAPGLAGKTLDGERFELRRLRGKVVLVNVWASWCAPCRDELPLLVEAGRRLAPHGLRIVGLSFRDGTVPARELLADVGAGGFRSVQDPDGRIAVSWGVRGVPETFVLDRRGVIRAHRAGPVTADWLRRNVVPLVM